MAKYIIKATVYDNKGRVLSVGYNSYTKTHPKMHQLNKKVGLPEKNFLHAEVHALIKCKGNPHKIFIERYGHNNQPLLAKPCPICQLAIQEAGIKIIDYTK